MIKSNELRIANITAQGTVIELRQNAARVKYFGEGRERMSLVLYEDLEHIPLSEEWLLKFGFEEKEISVLNTELLVWINFSFFLTIRNNRELIYDYMGGNTSVKCVHQLQNLFFALTGEELKEKGGEK